jgi:predicted alpha-1,2-mannosidase
MYNRSGVVLMCLICIVWPVTVFADIASGLVGYWSFDNSADIGADGSGYGHNGTVNGNGITQTTGLQGRAAAFDGASVIEISATTLLNPTNAITVSFWYKSTQSASGGPFSIVRHDTHFTAGQLRDSQNLSTIAFDSTGTRFMVSTIWNGILNNGMWHHVAAAYGNGTYNLYVDGQWAAGNNSLTTQQKTLKSSSKNWVFGGKEGRSGEFYIGALDEIRVYNRLLSLSEIGLLSNGHQPHNPSPADGVHEQPVSELTLHWNPSLNPSIPDEPNPAITGYYLYYRLNDANFDDSGTTMVAIDADADHDGITDPTVSYGPLNFGAETTVYWKVFESLNNSTPLDAETIRGPVWSFRTKQSYDLQAGLVGCWGFENSSQIGADDSGYNHHGRVNGGTITPVNGIMGQAASFNGTSVIEIPAASALNPSKAITVSYWFRSVQPTPSSGCVSIIRHDLHFTGGQLRDTQNISSIGFDSTGSLIKISALWNNLFNNNLWHHVAAAYGDGTYNLYIDGQWVAGNNSLSTSQSTLQTSGTNWVFGGKEGAGGEFYIGDLDEIRVYNRRLSLPEIDKLATEPLYPFKPFPLNRADEQPETGLTLRWNASLNPSNPGEPNPAITAYYLYYRLNDADFDRPGTSMLQIEADADHDGALDRIASYGLLNFGTDQTVYWMISERLSGSLPDDAATIDGPVWSFRTRQTKLVILEQPSDQTVSAGDSVQFDVRFTSVTPPACTWYTGDNRPVSGQDVSARITQDSLTGEYTATLNINNVKVSQENRYYCVLSNECKTMESSHIQLNLTKGLIDWVDPTIGTSNSRWFYFSSACRPFGMVNLSPDTDTVGTWDSGYLYGKLNIRCFSHVHAWQLAGIPVLPTTGPFKGHLGMDAYQAAFSHADEIVKPGYHRIHLDTYNITAELTSTDRVGFHRYTFPASDESYIIFDVGAYLAHSATKTAHINKISDTQIEGYSVLSPTMRRPKEPYVYFSAEFSKPFEAFGVWQNGTLITPSPDSITGANTGGYVKFSTTDNEKILVKVAIAYTSMAQARKNLETELPGWQFDDVVQKSQDQWNQWLGRIEVEGGTAAQKIKFYTDLWHSILGRRIISDVDGKYCDMTGASPVIRTVPLDENNRPAYPHHNFDALWGAHWTINVLWSMVYPDVMNAFANTMISMYENGGYIPRGPSGGNYTHVMLGDPASSFFACAYNKGIRHYNAEKAYEGLRKNAFPGGLRDWASYEHTAVGTGGGMSDYVTKGYVPDSVTGSGTHNDGASMTLEYAYQDWCLAQFARALNKTDDYNLFTNRSYNYRNLWDPSVRYIRPRTAEGSFVSSFSPLSTHDFCESTSAVYSHYVPHDMRGLVTLFGGNYVYSDLLNNSFLSSEPSRFLGIGQMVDYSNQPGTQMAHLFNYSGAPWLTQKWVRKVKELTFGDITPYGGYNGDEDQGQMGALGVLMAIGLFEMDGGCAINPIYEITSPIFDRVIIHLDNRYYPGGTFEINAINNSTENMYIQSASLNGQDWNRCWFAHSDFASGGTLTLVMGPQPNTNWGSSTEMAPPSSPLNGDLNGDGKIDLRDLEILSQGWLSGYTQDFFFDLTYDWLL